MQAIIDELTVMHRALMGVELARLREVEAALQAGREDLLLVYDRPQGPTSVVLGKLENDRIPVFDPEGNPGAELTLSEVRRMLDEGAVCLAPRED